MSWNPWKLRRALAASEEVRRSVEERQQLLMQNLAAAVIQRDAEHRITYCSPYTEVLTGYSATDVVGHSGGDDFFLKHSPAEDRERIQRALSIVRSGELFVVRHRLEHRSGFELWVESRLVPIMSSDDSFLGSLAISLDVTATVHHEERMAEVNRDLRDFTYMLSHDLKSPLFTIEGMLGVLRGEDSLTKDAAEAVEHISTATKRLSALVNAILEYSRAANQEHPAQPLSLQSVLQSVLASLAPLVSDSGGTISNDIGEDVTVFGDQLKLSQVFTNILENAIKYREPSRPIRVTISRVKMERPGEVSIAIEDNGRGIAPEKLGDIFRPFHRGDATDIPGSGIGLACVKKLVDKAGGRITVTSTPGVGSRFVVTLRRAEAS